MLESVRRFACGVLASLAGAAAAQTDGTWQGTTAQWSNPANWAGGAVPGNGGAAVFKSGAGVVNTLTNDISGLTLGGMTFSNNVMWVINPGFPINFSADAAATNRIHVNESYLTFKAPLGTGAGTLQKTGGGYLVLTNAVSAFSGRWLIETDRVEIVSGTSLMATPSVYRADALVLNGGGVKNNDSSPVIPANMGITLQERGGFLSIGWQSYYTLTLASPITGPGALLINRNNGRMLLQNPANDYAGGTVVGTNGPGYNASNYACLQLDAEGVLPYGAGKGGLLVNGAWYGLVDLAGHSNRVSLLTVTPGGAVTNRVPGVGALYADNLDYRGRLPAGAKVVWGGGSFNAQIPDGAGAGVVEVAPAVTLSLSAPLTLGGAALRLNGSAVSRSTAAGAEAWVTTNGCLLLVGAAGGVLTAAGAEPLPALVLRGGVSADTDNATNAALACNADLIVDGPSDRPALFDAEVALPAEKRVTFRNSVWIRRLPPSGAWQVTPGADVYLEGAALASLASFTNAGCRIRIVAANAAGFGAALAPGAGGEVWYDTLALLDGRLTDSAANALAAAHDVALAGGTLGFDGQGTITHAGAVSGSGALVKADAGTAVLNGANSFAGSVTVNGGTLVAGSAEALGAAGNAVAVNGGFLGNAAGAALTVRQAVTVSGGGFAVNGGSLRLSGGLTLVTGTLNKQGNGELVVEGASLTATNGLNLTGGAVVLEVAPGTTNRLVSLKGTGDLVKRGNGVLIVRPDAAYTGKVVLEAGTLYDELAPANNPALWLDASASQSLTFQSGSPTNVIGWRDVRDAAGGVTNYPYAWLNALSPNLGAAGYKTALPPVLQPGALAGRPVLDFGAYRSGQWLEFAAVSNARTFFWVIGSQNSGGLLIGSPNEGAVRGGGQVDGTLLAPHALWEAATWNGASFRSAQSWTNGVAVDGTSVGLNGGYELVSTLTAGGAVVNGLAKEMRTTLTGGQADGAKRSGGQRLAEVLIYNRALTAAERQATEAYLMRKWFGLSQGGSQWGAELQVTGAGTLLLPHAGMSVAFDKISGGGTLTKAGGGTLTVESPESFGGTLALAEGGFTADGLRANLTAQAAPTNPVPGAAFWVDAGAAGTFGADAGGRVYWRDVRWTAGSDYLVATQRWAYAATVLSNAVGALPVVDLGPTNTPTVEKGLQWSKDLTNVRAVFCLIGSQQGGGILLGGNDGTAHFIRGNVASAATPIFWGDNVAANIKSGTTRLDGLPVDGTATGFSGGYQVVALRAVGDVTAGQFAHDRTQTARGGGQRLGEVIVYTNALSDAQMAQVEAYLLNKWQRPGTRDVRATLARLEAPAEGAPPVAGTLDVGVRTLAVQELVGTGVLQKTGSATLAVGRYGPFAGGLDVAGGRVALLGYSAVVRTPAFWVDASRTDTLEYDAGTLEIAKWHDCRRNGLYAEKAAAASQTVGGMTYPNLMPTVALNALNGLPVVDFGAWTGNRFLTWSQPLTHIRTVFWVLGSQAGGGHLLTYDRDTATRCFFRGGSGGTFDNWNVVDKDCTLWSAVVAPSFLPVINGQTRKNGVVVNGSQTGLSGGYDLVSLRTTGDASASGFCNDRNRAWRNATGGQRLAEAIIYEEALSDDEIRQVESYLRVKWGLPLAPETDVPNDTAVSAMRLTLLNGAVLELGGSQKHAIGTLGGVGSVTTGALTVAGIKQVSSADGSAVLALAGSLKVTAPAAWSLAVTAGDPVPVQAAGGITFEGGVTLTVSGGASLADGPHLLAAAVDGSALTGFVPDAWSVTSDDNARQFSVSADGAAVYLVASGKGTMLLLK